jgi:ABC-2 type transport system permease protein
MNRGRVYRGIVWNDLLQSFRSSGGLSWKQIVLRLIAFAAFVALHWWMGTLFRVLGTTGARPAAHMLELMFWSGVGVLTFIAGIQLSLSILFERNDMDLLLCSPAPPSLILGARITSLLLTEMVGLGFFILPVLDMLVWHKPHRNFGPHLTWIGITLLAVDCGLLLTLLLVRWLGVRRARTLVQVIGSILGAGLFLLSQSFRYFQSTQALTASPQHLGRQSLSFVQHLRLESVLAIPRGEPVALLIFALVLAVITRWTVNVSARAFLSGWQEAGQGSRRGVPFEKLRFHGGVLSSTVRKELRLIFRQPTTLSSLLLPFVYMVPGLWMAFQGHRMMTIPSLGLLGCSMLSSSCALLASGAEECYDLLRMSPVPPRRILLGKVLAACVPCFLLAVAFSGVLLWKQEWLATAAFLFSSLLLGMTTAWIQASSARRIKATEVLKRGRGGSWASSLVMMLHLAAAVAGVLPFFTPYWWIGAAWLFVWAWLAVGTMVLWPQTRFESLYAAEAELISLKS